MDLQFEVVKQQLKRIDIEEPVNNSQEYLRLCFDFKTDDWTGSNKYVFFRVHRVNYQYPLTETDDIIVPSIFLTGKHVDFGVYGVLDDYRITTNSLRIQLDDSKFEGVDDAPFNIDTVLKSLRDSIDDKVDKVEGYGLSSNDFDNNYKYIIDNLPDTIENHIAAHDNSTVSHEDIRARIDDIETEIDLKNYYNKTEIDDKVSDINTVLSTKQDKEDMDTVTVLVTYTDESTEEIVLYRVPPT